MPLKSYVVPVGPTGAEIGYTWKGPSDLYDSIKSELGVQDLSAYNGITVSGRTGAFVPRIRFQTEDQNGVSKSYTVFCDPAQYETCLTSLKGKTVRGGTIRRVRYPKKRIFV